MPRARRGDYNSGYEDFEICRLRADLRRGIAGRGFDCRADSGARIRSARRDAPDAPAADAQDAISPEEKEQRLEAARSFMQTYPIETMWGDIVERLVAGQPDDFVAFVRANAEKTDYGVLRERMRESLIAVFTAEELSALADFSRQTEGRVVRKFTPLTAQLLPGFQAEFFKLFVLPPADPAPENPPAAVVEDAEAESPPAADSDSDSDSESSAS